MTLALFEAGALPFVVFLFVVASTLGITYWSARAERSAAEYLTAGRSVGGFRNGMAIAGEYVSASTFLGVTGLIFLFGFDGVIYLVGALTAFLLLLFVLAERLRNVGEFTMADVLSFRLRRRPVRAAAAGSTLVIACGYVLAQLVGGGLLFEELVGLGFAPSVVLTAGLMLVYVFFGGMRATTWVQVVKAGLLLGFGVILTVLVLVRTGFDPVALFGEAKARAGGEASYVGPGGLFANPFDAVSVVVAYALGTAALPHILLRFFTVKDAGAARSSAQWSLVLIGLFFVVVTILGFGARAILPPSAEEAVGVGGNLTAPILAQELGGGLDSFGGELMLAIVAAITFATILAVVSGLVMSASGAIAHDLYNNVIRRGAANDREIVRVARATSVVVSVVGAGATIVAGPEFNITFLVALAFAIAASSNLPPLILSLSWERFNTAGALTGMATGLLSSVLLIVLSPTVWPGAAEAAPFPLTNPAVLSVPLGFLGCVVGTLLGTSGDEEHTFTELQVRSQTGLGAVTAEEQTS